MLALFVKFINKKNDRNVRTISRARLGEIYGYNGYIEVCDGAWVGTVIDTNLLFWSHDVVDGGQVYSQWYTDGGVNITDVTEVWYEEMA